MARRMAHLSLLVAAACWVDASAQFLAQYSCDNVNVQGLPDLNYTKFAGSGPWHEIERVVEVDAAAALQGTCANATFTHNATTAGVSALSVLYADVSDHKRRNFTAAGTITVGATSVSLTAELASVAYPLRVLYTDYNNYALVHVCQPINDTSCNVFLSKMSRSGILTEANATAIKNYLDNQENLKSKNFTRVDRSPQACSAAATLAAAFTILAATVGSVTLLR